ncbi:uncharacterized protein LOC142166789 [Nicotiana tabacum]|uniref:Uncharacterized protein LOC142166789 n=1 Tax=Nicotiana tabacum TaxID=4097 RepID=A0AC58SB56_TOBAC
MVSFLESYLPYVVTKRVQWQLAYNKWFKCNTDGVFKGNPGPSSYALCVRNDAGDVLFAKAEELGLSTNTIAEAKAIVEGLSYCVQKQLHPLIIQTDSMLMKKIIDGIWEVPWNIGKEINKINQLKHNFNVIFEHVLREGNTLADYLAKFVFSSAGSRENLGILRHLQKLLCSTTCIYDECQTLEPVSIRAKKYSN